MANYILYENQGSLFPVKEKKSEKSPDLTGSINIAGKILQLAAWKRTSKNGNQYLSVSIKEFNTGAVAGGQEFKSQNNTTDTDENIPF